MADDVPVITIDGPSGSGKGTLSQMLAKQLRWHYLDSGVLYRALALAAQRARLATSQIDELSCLAKNLPVEFVADSVAGYRITLDRDEITQQIRSEACSKLASHISAIAEVRSALLARQRAFAEWPGLVTDGRDMGTIIFPNAALKIFLTASAEERALRRYNQLKEKGNNVSLSEILAELMARDKRDSERVVAPLVPAKDAVVIDTTGIMIPQVLQALLALAEQRFGFNA
jgi:cytidylate kinase